MEYKNIAYKICAKILNAKLATKLFLFIHIYLKITTDTQYNYTKLYLLCCNKIFPSKNIFNKVGKTKTKYESSIFSAGSILLIRYIFVSKLKIYLLFT